MKKIQLSKTGWKYKGKEALVDDDIFDIVNQYDWTYQIDTKSGNEYARQATKNVQLHNYVWILKVGEIPKGLVVDHINGDGLNNQISNLRLATRRQNNCNKRIQKNNTSGFTGIHKKFDKIKYKNKIYEYHYWYAEITYDKTYVKKFRYNNDEEEQQQLKNAIQWRKDMENELHQKFSGSNRPKNKK